MCSIWLFYMIAFTTVSSILTLPSINEKKVLVKRGISLYPEASVYPLTQVIGTSKLASLGATSFPINNYKRSFGPSTIEVANAIATAKQASANVLIAQQQVQAAKDNVLAQQKIAMEKEKNAAILTQKSEAAAAIQRSEAATAAQSVVLAQQRLASAKSEVAKHQRIAATKEAEAAAALQSSAHAASVEIQRSENEATKLANLQRAGAAALAQHVSATKDAAIIPITTGNNYIKNLGFQYPSNYELNPWIPFAGPYTSYNQKNLYPAESLLWQ